MEKPITPFALLCQLSAHTLLQILADIEANDPDGGRLSKEELAMLKAIEQYLSEAIAEQEEYVKDCEREYNEIQNRFADIQEERREAVNKLSNLRRAEAVRKSSSIIAKRLKHTPGGI